jgi:hypothetical protein
MLVKSVGNRLLQSHSPPFDPYRSHTCIQGLSLSITAVCNRLIQMEVHN